MSKDKAFKLHREQEYALAHAARLGIPIELKQHEYKTKTCKQKAALLSETLGQEWTPDRVIKALYFHPPQSPPGHYVGIITPETGMEVDVSGVVAQVPRLEQRVTDSYTLQVAPRGMSPGTCTPFPRSYVVLDRLMVGVIDSIIFCDFPQLDEKVVDISLGGDSDSARKTSMHITYGGIYHILKAQFGDWVVKVPPKHGRPIHSPTEDHFYA